MVDIIPTNDCQKLNIVKVKRGKIRLTAVFNKDEKSIAIVSKHALLKALDVSQTDDFGLSSLRGVKVDDRKENVFLYFKPNPIHNLVVVNREELKRAVKTLL